MSHPSARERVSSRLAKYSIHARMDEYMARLHLPCQWQRCAFAFLQSIYDLSGSDQSLYDYHGVLCRFFASGIDPGRVTKTDIEAFLTCPSHGRGRAGRPISPATRNHRQGVLTSFYKFASGYHVDGAPLYQKALPTLGIAYSQPDIVYKAMSEQELLAFFAAIPDTPVGWRDRAAFLMYFWTARRKIELARLRWGDIEPALFDGRPGYVYRYTSKGKSRQTKAKELPKPAYDALICYLEKSGRLATMQPDSPLFVPTKLSGKPKDRRGAHEGMSADYLSLQFNRYRDKAGLDAKFTLHSLRHTSAHERDQAGQELYALSETLDHSDPGTTWHYLRRMSGTADSGAALLERNPRLAGLGMTR